MASALHWPVGSSRRVSSATRSDSGALAGRYVGLKVFRGDAPGLRVGVLDAPGGHLRRQLEPAPRLPEAHRATQRIAVGGVGALLGMQERDGVQIRACGPPRRWMMRTAIPMLSSYP